jgi:hypothetical protein
MKDFAVRKKSSTRSQFGIKERIMMDSKELIKRAITFQKFAAEKY